jgi:hypothetical protein
MRGPGFWGWKRQCSPESCCPRRRNPRGGERRWWRGRAVEGTGKVIEGAHGVGAELGAVLGGLRCAGVAACGGSVMASKVRFGGGAGAVKRVAE